MPQLFTPFQQAVIGHLIARAEGGRPPDYLQDYFKALDGGFDRSLRFTLHAPEKNKLCLYYQVTDPAVFYMERGAFTGICEKIKNRFVDIAQYIVFLADNGLVIPEFKPRNYVDIPREAQKHWRRYQNFYPAEAEPILFIKSITPIPTEKLLTRWSETRLVTAT